MEMNEKYIKSMEFCQATITRMANNSFMLKKWFLLIITAIITAFSKLVFFEQSEYQFHLHYLFFLAPLFIFPYLDAYYLKQERVFREIYNDFMNSINQQKIIRKPFNMKPTKEQRKQFSLLNVLFSISIAPFYFIIICFLQGLIIYQSSIAYSLGWISIIPLLLITLGWIFKKKTSHQK